MQSLNHELTPSELASLNQAITNLLSADEVSDAELKAIVDARDDFIQAYLQKLSTDDAAAFAKQELLVNQYLAKQVGDLFKRSLSDLFHLHKSRKAIEKYKHSS